MNNSHEKMLDGKMLSRNTVVNQYEKLVYSHARRLAPQNPQFVEDLSQVGFIGLISAFDNYDEGHGVKFVTFAFRYIYGHMLRENHKKGLLHTPVHIVSTAHKIDRAGLWDLSDDDIAAQLNLSVYDVVNSRIYFGVKDNTSLDKPSDDGEGRELSNALPFADDLSGVYVDEYLERLTEREKFILVNLMNGYKQAEIARIMGLSRVRVGQITKRMKEKLEKIIDGEEVEC